jgi:hypothetical protein
LLGGLLSAHKFAEPSLRDAALVAANRPGFVTRRGCAQKPCALFRILPMSMSAARGVGRELPTRDLLIALAAPTGDGGLTPIGIAGQGFHGELTSDSTRTRGYVLSTDLLPTVLQAFGADADLSSHGVTADSIRGEGAVDARELADLGMRMAAIPDRREPILLVCILAWLLVAFAVSRLVFRLRRMAMAWLALCFAFMPLLLLAGSWLELSAVAEGLLVGFGSALVAALTVRLAPGWRGLAVACAITVTAYGIDVVTGSELTRLSLLGPNPIFGARFYGIGNELEALIAVMVPVGAGAALTARRPGKAGNQGGAVAAFIGAGLLAAVVFSIGRFGADVGAAIVLPVGAAAAGALVRGGSVRIGDRQTTTNQHGRTLAAVIAAPILVVGLTAFIDLVSGGSSHLVRSVLDAGGASDLADIAQRRLELSADDFAQAADNPLFWLVVAGICAFIARWRRIDVWLRLAPFARAGFLGACAAVLVGVLVNDSGATFLVLGSLALGATLAFAWAQAGMDP